MKTFEEMPVMKGRASMALGADDYFEVPLFSHVIGKLWQGCSPAEFPDELESNPFWTPSRNPVNCKWLYRTKVDSTDIDTPRFDKILNLYQWGEYVVPEGTEQVTVEAYDGSKVDYNTFQDAADIVMDWMDDNNEVLVHCQAGLNRSSFVVALILMQRFEFSADDAINHIKESRSPLCLCNDHFRQYLQGLA